MLGPMNWIGLVVFGGGLLWAVHLASSGKRVVRGTVVRGVQLAAALMIVMGLVGPLVSTSPIGWLFAIALLVVLAMAVSRFRTNGARQLMWTLAHAAEHDLPLAESARAFAADRSDELGRRVWHLAERLDQGASLDEALTSARLPTTTSTLLFARLGHTSGVLKARSGSRKGEVTSAASSQAQLFPTLVYLIIVLLFTTIVSTFMMIKIVPTFVQIMDDFEMPIPVVTQVLIAIAEQLANGPLLTSFAGLLTLAMLALTGYLLLRYLGWIHWEIPGLLWMERPYHGARVAAALSTELEHGHDLPSALRRLERAYPAPHVSMELRETREAIGRGTPWPVAFSNSPLYSRSVGPLLEAADAVGNVPWVLSELSDQILRRTEYRRQLMIQWLTPCLMLIVALPIGFMAVALLSPLFQLVASLA